MLSFSAVRIAPSALLSLSAVFERSLLVHSIFGRPSPFVRNTALTTSSVNAATTATTTSATTPVAMCGPWSFNDSATVAPPTASGRITYVAAHAAARTPSRGAPGQLARNAAVAVRSGGTPANDQKMIPAATNFHGTNRRRVAKRQVSCGKFRNDGLYEFG